MGRQKKLPEILTAEELKSFFSAIPDSWSGVRNYALLRLMVGTGLRVSEALNLKRKHFDFARQRLTVRGGKGGYDRVMGLGESEAQPILKWFGLLGDISPDKPIFINRSGKQMSRRYVHELVVRLATAAGINKRVHPHTLRHTFGTMHYAHFRDLRQTQEAMGHASVGTTQIYTKIEAEAVVQGMVELQATFCF